MSYWIKNCWTGTLVTMLMLALMAGSANAAPEPLEPKAEHPDKARLIANLLTHQHFRKQPIDDMLSATVLDSYIDRLDAERYYFLADDVEEFAVYRGRLDDLLMQGDLDAAFEIYERYRQRNRERSEFALSLLQDGLDFDTDDEIELNRRKADWAVDREELDQLWRKRVKHDALTLLLAGEGEEETKELLRNRYRGMKENVERMSSEDVFEMFMGAWSRAFDPHTAYLSPRNSREFDIQMRLSLEGIGAVLRTQRDFVEIMELVPGGPAARSGHLSPGDRIIGVGQEGEDLQDVVGWRLSDVVDLIRGPRDSEVRLRILPGSAGSDSAARTVTLVRSEIELEEQAAKSEIRDIERHGSTQRVGVITIPAFYSDFAAAQAGDEDYRSTTRDVRRLIREMEEEGIDGIVIDLRGNSGGSLQEAADMTGLFIPEGPIVQIKRSDGDKEIMRDRDTGVAYDGPLSVMVDRFSASASEIFAGAIQDYGRGLVLGEQTFGKGTVQTLVDLNRFTRGRSDEDEAGRMKLTIAKFYRVTGSSTQKRGIVPDITFPSLAGAEEVGESAADNPLPWDQIDSTNFTRFGELDDTIALLKNRHEERSASDEAYQAYVAEMEKLSAMNDRETVSLHWETREADRDQRNQERLAKANRRREAHGLDPIDSLDELDLADDEPDTLLDATVAIMADLFVINGSPETARRWENELTKR